MRRLTSPVEMPLWLAIMLWTLVALHAVLGIHDLVVWFS